MTQSSEIASSFVSLTPRNDGFAGLIKEIASVALLPRNDGISGILDEIASLRSQ